MKGFRVAGLVGLVALASLVSPKESKADANISVSGGVQIPSEEVASDNFSSGFTFAVEGRLANPKASLEMGLAYYNSPGDYFSFTDRGFLYRRSGSSSEFSSEVSINGGATKYFRGRSKTSPALGIGVGVKHSILTDKENTSETGYRESSSSRTSIFRDIINGYYLRVIFDFPFDRSTPVDHSTTTSKSEWVKKVVKNSAPSWFLRGEVRNIEQDEGDYTGYSLSLGVNF